MFVKLWNLGTNDGTRRNPLESNNLCTYISLSCHLVDESESMTFNEKFSTEEVFMKESNIFDIFVLGFTYDLCI